MRKYFFNTIIKCSFLLLTTFLTSCNDIFEKNIANSTVIVIIPKANDTLLSNFIHFKWESLEGATEYQLHIVKPNFEYISEYMLDSLIQGNEFQMVLEPGTYQFKIRAVNSAYESKFTQGQTFVVDSVSDLSTQVVQLLSPENGTFTNNQNIELFLWQKLFFADAYNFQIWNGENFGEGSLLHQQNNIYGINYSFYFSSGLSLVEGAYSWGINAINEVSESAYTSRTFYIDTTAPNNPSLSFPANNYVSPSNQITLKWTKNGSDYGVVQSPVYSNVQISYNDSLYGSENTVEISDILNDSLPRNFVNSGSYWWRVYLSDKAGNESYYYSESNKIIIP